MKLVETYQELYEMLGNMTEEERRSPVAVKDAENDPEIREADIERKRSNGKIFLHIHYK